MLGHNLSSGTSRLLPILLACLTFTVSYMANAGDRYAFVVGVQHYDKAELTSLRFTEKDAESIAEALRASGYRGQNVVLLSHTVGAKEPRYSPLADNIRRELKLLLSEVREDDFVLLALTGHGVQFQGEKDSYFCPADARLSDRRTLISLGEVYRSLDECKAGGKVMLVDACRNDPLSNLAKSRPVVKLESLSNQPAPPPGGIAAFFSCSAGQESFEHPSLANGVFFHYVVRGIRGEADSDKDEEVSLPELEQYAVKNVQSFVRAELGRSQTPERRGEAHGLLVLSTPKLPVTLPAPTSPAARGSTSTSLTPRVPLAAVRLERKPDAMQVFVDEKLFTIYVTSPRFVRPCLYPIHTKDGTVLTRPFATQGQDHPDQVGLWISADQVNGVDFWSGKNRIENKALDEIVSEGDPASFRVVNHWLDNQAKPILIETTTVSIYSNRLIACDIQLSSNGSRVTFGDTKESLIGIRIADSMREGYGGTGKVVSANGTMGSKNCWGKQFPWLDCYGPIGTRTYGVAFFDHPSNQPRGRFHVRDYGLLALNSFGEQSFTNAPAKRGPTTLAPGRSIRLRYGVYVHEGAPQTGKVAQAYAAYTKMP